MARQETIVMYFHPFDILPQKSNHPEFGLTIRKWYNFRSAHALDTLKGVVDFFGQHDYNFITLQKFYVDSAG
jgi:hypothetical protein